jgi:hypothetical protein
MERKCVICGSVLVQRPTEANSRFLTRQFCSIKCAASKPRKAKPEQKYCMVCNEPVKFLAHESRAHYKNKRFCSASAHAYT